MDDEPSPTRRNVLQGLAGSGVLASGGLLATGSASAQQGGVAYLKEGQLRGKNNPDEPRFRITEECWTDEVDLPCDGNRAKTYTAYKIRCPNHGSGGGGGHDPNHEHGCGGDHDHNGGCGRHILVNANRNVRTGDLHVFTAVQDCGEDYVRAAFKPAKK